MRVVELSDVVHIEDLSHDGRGIARVEGKIVFVEGALPGEKVRFAYIKKRKDYDEARVHEIIEASPERVEPACPHFGVCGGCSLQHLSAEGQLKYKQNHWLSLMKKMGGGLPNEVLAPLQTDIWGYRRKARLGVKYVPKKEKVLLGFREKRNPQYLMDMEDCHILHSRIRPAIPQIKALLNAMPSAKQIAQIEISVGEQCALVFRNLIPLEAKDEALLEQFGQETGFKIYLQPKGPDSLILFYPKEASFSMSFEIPQYDVHMTYEPLDFIQVNQSMNEAMIAQALLLLDLKPSDRVLDLFCGLGNFTLPLAKTVSYVYGVEGNEQMLKRAKANAESQSIDNVEFTVADLQLTSSVEELKKLDFNKVLIDPARDGALAVVEGLGELGPERIVYVSCHPATLARDAHVLRTKYGYQMVCGGVMDMFPHTIHIESMALFVKG
jgi:23S rRNA (uracil1939-C5)-methyltransferase